ncbi:MAG: tRNA (adenosine(37)-N6)-dimethylallyltransferase MiaA [Bacteroidetes bacterium]|nr:tRNA (adenosine(37)-N6)-dimethylallyltransferase MiaA [Bacteroidota bacterium]
MPTLIVICGPTASGKTQVAISIAQQLSAPIINFDSRQFFRELNIGTAKPTPEQLVQAKHFFIDSHSITDEYNAVAFGNDAQKLIDELSHQHQYIILCGGSGLYLNAVLFGMDAMPEISKSIRQTINKNYEQFGLSYLQEEVKKADAKYYETVDTENPHRLIRALEVYMQTGKPFSDFRNGQNKNSAYDYQLCGITLPREQLYERINQRTDMMIAQGLENETRQVIDYRKHHALQTVGYKEMFQYIDGEISLQQTIDLIKQHTRNYAKRQITWFKKYDNINWYAPNEVDKIMASL